MPEFYALNIKFTNYKQVTDQDAPKEAVEIMSKA